MRNKIVFGMMAAAGCALSVLPSQASITTNVVQSFEALGTGSSIAGVTAGGGTWYGSSVIAENSISYAGSTSVGWTLAGDHDKQLDVAGTVSNKFTATAANSPVTVDMMVQIALPDDDLDFPSSVTDRDSIQIAVGVATNATSPTTQGDLYAYCKNKAGTVGWYSLGVTLDKDTWHRVSFTFDYSQQLCQIRVDGEPAITSNGYLVNDATSEYTAGSWYKLAASKTQLSSVEVVGSTAIDEMLVTTSSTVAEAAPVIADADRATPAASTGVEVNNAWIEAQGITRAAVTANEEAPDGTGMTIAQKYAAGFDVADGKEFEILDMDLSGGNAVIKFNSANIPTGYKYVIETSASSDFSSPTTTEVTGSTTGSAALSLEGDVKYYRMKLTNE